MKIISFEQKDKTVVDLGVCEGRDPSRSLNFFIFMQCLGKIGQIVCWRPCLRGCSPLWVILDPPLLTTRLTLNPLIFHVRSMKFWMFLGIDVLNLRLELTEIYLKLFNKVKTNYGLTNVCDKTLPIVFFYYT